MCISVYQANYTFYGVTTVTELIPESVLKFYTSPKTFMPHQNKFLAMPLVQNEYGVDSCLPICCRLPLRTVPYARYSSAPVRLPKMIVFYNKYCSKKTREAACTVNDQCEKSNVPSCDCRELDN